MLSLVKADIEKLPVGTVLYEANAYGWPDTPCGQPIRFILGPMINHPLSDTPVRALIYNPGGDLWTFAWPESHHLYELVMDAKIAGALLRKATPWH